jgi:hypothetical protein
MWFCMLTIESASLRVALTIKRISLLHAALAMWGRVTSCAADWPERQDAEGRPPQSKRWPNSLRRTSQRAHLRSLRQPDFTAVAWSRCSPDQPGLRGLEGCGGGFFTRSPDLKTSVALYRKNGNNTYGLNCGTGVTVVSYPGATHRQQQLKERTGSPRTPFPESGRTGSATRLQEAA